MSHIKEPHDITTNRSGLIFKIQRVPKRYDDNDSKEFGISDDEDDDDAVVVAVIDRITTDRTMLLVSSLILDVRVCVASTWK